MKEQELKVAGYRDNTGSAAADGFTAISSDSLRSQSPMEVISPRPSVEAAGFQGFLETQAQNNQDDFTRSLETKANKAKSGADESFETYLSSLLSSDGKTTVTDRLYSKDGGVDDIQKELNKINQDIRSEQAALFRQKELIEKNAGGMYGTAVQDEINRVEKESLRKQADMTIIQMGIQGRFDSAKAIADRAVAAATEREKNINDALKATYDRNQSLFTEAEKRAFESAQTDRENELEMKKTTLEKNYDLAIEAMKNGAPTGVVQNIMKAGTTEQALGLAGPYQTGGGTGSGDPVVDAWVSQIKGGQATIANVPEKLKNAVVRALSTGSGQSELQLAQDADNVRNIQSILETPNLANAVGTNALARINIKDAFTGEKSNFIASVEQLRSQLTLDSLIQAKAKGATFGALSDGELKTLSASASKLGTWAIKDENGNVTGYKANPKDFKAELDRINNFAKLDYVLKGGAPEDVGVIKMPDGSLITENSDGTIIQLR